MFSGLFLYVQHMSMMLMFQLFKLALLRFIQPQPVYDHCIYPMRTFRATVWRVCGRAQPQVTYHCCVEQQQRHYHDLIKNTLFHKPYCESSLFSW